MTVDELLIRADPTRELSADATDWQAPAAEALLARIVEQDRDPASRRQRAVRKPRRLVYGATLVAAVAAVIAVVLSWGLSGPGSGSRAFAVTPGDGDVRVAVHWSELSDPAALQAALDRAGAQVRIFVTDDPNSACAMPSNTTPYRDGAVEWTSSPQSDDGGFIVRPATFPPDGTFVVSVHLAPPGSTGQSTFAPSGPQLTSIDSFMVVGAVPSCGP